MRVYLCVCSIYERTQISIYQHTQISTYQHTKIYTHKVIMNTPKKTKRVCITRLVFSLYTHRVMELLLQVCETLLLYAWETLNACLCQDSKHTEEGRETHSNPQHWEAAKITKHTQPNLHSHIQNTHNQTYTHIYKTHTTKLTHTYICCTYKHTQTLTHVKCVCVCVYIYLLNVTHTNEARHQ